MVGFIPVRALCPISTLLYPFFVLFIQILFDNVKHDGRMPVHLKMNNTWLDCKNGKIKGSDQFSKSCMVL